MKQESIRDRLTSQFGSNVVRPSVSFRDQISVVISPENLLSVCRFLKEDAELSFDFLSFVCGVDLCPNSPRFEVVYQLYSTKQNHRFRLKTLLEEPAEGLPAVESVTGIWPTADWHERETSEMFGITFRNHPDPRKLLLPDSWAVHPLRKDFPLHGTQEDTPDLPSRKAF